jgi:hypothetical protein
MKKRILTILALLLAVGALWFGWSAYRASRKLVTLDVRNMPVRQVCKLIERQTWETIHVAKEVDGKVTLRVKDTPLDDVLGIVAEQVNARSSAVYPLYTTKSSLARLVEIALGQQTDLAGWKAWRSRPFGGGPFADALREGNKLVTLQLVDKDAEFAALALNRFARAQVVPEDGTTNLVRLILHNATMPEAVDKLAKQSRRDWTVFYTLQPGFFGRRGPFGDTNMVAGMGGDTNLPPFAFFGRGRRGGTNDAEGTNNFPGPGMGMMGGFMGGPGMQRQLEAQMATMTLEEQKRAQEMQQRMEEIRNLPPEQRQAKMAELFQSSDMQNRIQNRMVNVIKNTTPEQRVDRTRTIMEMRQRFENRPPGN